MTNDEIKAFYRDLGDVCNKHNISGLAGVWFSGAGHDEFGQMKFWNVTDFRMKVVVEKISQLYDDWARVTINHTSRPLGEIREVSGRGGEKN